MLSPKTISTDICQYSHIHLYRTKTSVKTIVWAYGGVKTNKKDSGVVECVVSHLTNFAVLMSATEIKVCLIICFCVYCLLWCLCTCMIRE